MVVPCSRQSCSSGTTPTRNKIRACASLGLEPFTVQTLGEQAHMQVKDKAAETRPLVLFCAWLLERYGHALKGDEVSLLPACKALVQFIELMRASPQRLNASQRQGMHDSFQTVLGAEQEGRSAPDAQSPPAPAVSSSFDDEDDAPAVASAPVEAKPSTQKAEDILAMIRARQKQ